MPSAENALAGIGADIEEGMPPEVLLYQHDLAGNRPRDGERADAVLAASIFHFGQYTVSDVKRYLAGEGVPVRLT